MQPDRIGLATASHIEQPFSHQSIQGILPAKLLHILDVGTAVGAQERIGAFVYRGSQLHGPIRAESYVVAVAEHQSMGLKVLGDRAVQDGGEFRGRHILGPEARVLCTLKIAIQNLVAKLGESEDLQEYFRQIVRDKRQQVHGRSFNPNLNTRFEIGIILDPFGPLCCHFGGSDGRRMSVFPDLVFP
jgi:hypothetical protein